MIFLWNKERILSEIFELAKLRISQKLEIPPDDVHVHLKLEEGNLLPGFQVKASQVKDANVSKIKTVFSDVWGSLKPQLQERLASLSETRYGYRH